MSGLNNVALVIGRILLAALLLIAAYNKFKGYDATIAYFGRLGIPSPNIMAPVTEAFEVICAILLIIGWQTRLVALAVAAFVIVAAGFAHMNFADGNQLNHFLKNVAIAGGCLALFVSGAGAFSLDGRSKA